MKFIAAVVRNIKKNTTFIGESGCTRNITEHPQNFTKIVNMNLIRVPLADNREVDAKKEGSVCTDLTPINEGEQKMQLIMICVLYIPDAGVEMISCSQMDSVGIYTVLGDRKCIIHDRYSK